MKSLRNLLAAAMLLAVCFPILGADIAPDVPALGASAPPAAPAQTGSLALLITLVAPMLTAAVRKYVPKISKVWLPVACAGFGFLLALVDQFSLNSGVTPLWGIILGAAGIGLREAIDQARKRISKPEKALGLVLALGCSALASAGCKGVAPGADPVLVRSEQALEISFSTMDTFLKLEHKNSAFIKDKVPAAHKFAEYLREFVEVPQPDGTKKRIQRGLAYIESASAARKAYKENRTVENKANLATALAVIETMLSETQKHLTSIK